MTRMTVAALVALAGCTAAETQRYPFEGRWDCQVSEFAFSATGYSFAPGEPEMPYERVEQDGRNYVIGFADGYRIGLSSITPRSLTWLSFETGDTFDCTRVE